MKIKINHTDVYQSDKAFVKIFNRKYLDTIELVLLSWETISERTKYDSTTFQFLTADLHNAITCIFRFENDYLNVEKVSR